MAAPFRYDRTFAFDVSRAVLWDALNDTAQFPQWWPWLRAFDASDLSPGTVAHCAVRGPLPYTLEFQVLVAAVDPGTSIAAEVSGDLTGPARLEVGGEGAVSEARLTWEVELRVPMLSAASLVARPVLVWAHDRVVETGLAEFRQHALTTPRGRG